MSGRASYWTPAELEIVRAMYPVAHWKDILKAIPGRTEDGVSNVALPMGCKRPRKLPNGTPKSKPRTPEQKAARSAREGRRTRKEMRDNAMLSADDKKAAARRKAGLNGAEVWAQQARMREAQSMDCLPGTYRASNGVTLAQPGQAHLYSERRPS